MKKLSLILLLIFTFNTLLKSQDIILYHNGTEVESKVLKVGKTEIAYKKYSNLNGPEYTEEINNIFMIKYEGGGKDVFSTNEVTNENQQVDNNIDTESESYDDLYAGKEISYYDGVPLISYAEKNVVLGMSLRQGRKYGKYYIAEVLIFNGSGGTIDFIPTNFIHPTFINGGIATTADIMSYEEYNKKVKNHQAWRAVAVGFANAYSASQAGYSTSYSSGSVHGYGTSTTNASAYAYGSGGWGSAYGTSTTNSSVNLYGNSTTTTYDGGTAYAASQNAGRNTANFMDYQNIDRSQIKYEYLKRHTLKNGEEISGKINIPYKDADIVEITILFDGKEYIFDFTRELILKLDD
jgi:hypothetical protein